MWLLPWVYVSFCGVSWVIFGRIREASDDVCEEADVVHSERMVELCAMQELGKCAPLVTGHLVVQWGWICFLVAHTRVEGFWESMRKPS